IVEEGAAGAIANAGGGKMGRCGGVRELAVSQIPVKPIVTVIGHQEIRFTVVIIIADTDSLGPAFHREACLARNISEFPPAVVTVELEGALGACRWGVESRPIGDQNIICSIAVVVKDGGSIAGGFQDVGLFLLASVCVRQREARRTR